MEIIPINVSRPYDVLIGRGLLKDAVRHLSSYISDCKVLIVTDENIEAQGYSRQLVSLIEGIANKVQVHVIPAGEAQKNLANVQEIIGILADNNFSREDRLIALGGGVIGDLVGFTASIYLRGIAYIQIPTTFLAAIDSSVGGKTAVDIPQGKNMVGAFHHPLVVLCDVNSFKTLPRPTFEDGCSELIKYAMIMNPSLLEALIKRPRPLIPEDKDIVELVKACVEMKRDVVQEDETDQGLRQLLNFGHTLGHAIEQRSHYGVSHGRAVARGMAVFTQLAHNQGYLEESLSKPLEALLNQYHLLTADAPYNSEELLETMFNDKKRRRQEISLVLPVAFGRSDLVKVDIATFREWFIKEWDSNEDIKRH